MEIDNLYNIKETARKLGVSRYTIYNYIKDGKLKVTKVNGFNKISESEIKKMRGEM